MEIQYVREYSDILKKEVEYKIYGHTGRPVLFIPCQDGRFFDFENFRMLDVWQPWIDSGQVMVFSIDTIDKETWSNPYGDARWRIERYESWIWHIVNEMVPCMQQIARERGSKEENPGILIFGCSLGATHAANLYFRFPHIFTKLLALSGLYGADYGFGSYMDDLVYQNSPVNYLGNMPKDHPYINLYNQNQAIICVGQGPWEMPDLTRDLHHILIDKGINAWVDYWGYDCAHDWDWWFKQVNYFLLFLLK